VQKSTPKKKKNSNAELKRNCKSPTPKRLFTTASWNPNKKEGTFHSRRETSETGAPAWGSHRQVKGGVVDHIWLGKPKKRDESKPAKRDEIQPTGDRHKSRCEWETALMQKSKAWEVGRRKKTGKKKHLVLPFRTLKGAGESAWGAVRKEQHKKKKRFFGEKPSKPGGSNEKGVKKRKNGKRELRIPANEKVVRVGEKENRGGYPTSGSYDWGVLKGWEYSATRMPEVYDGKKKKNWMGGQ